MTSLKATAADAPQQMDLGNKTFAELGLGNKTFAELGLANMTASELGLANKTLSALGFAPVRGAGRTKQAVITTDA